MEMMDEFLLQEGSIENQLQQKFSQIEKQRQESKAEIEQLTAKKKKTADDLEVFRNQLRSKVEEDVDMDTKQSVLNSLIKKLKVDQNGLIEIDFCVALGNTHTWYVPDTSLKSSVEAGNENSMAKLPWLLPAWCRHPFFFVHHIVNYILDDAFYYFFSSQFIQ